MKEKIRKILKKLKLEYFRMKLKEKIFEYKYFKNKEKEKYIKKKFKDNLGYEIDFNRNPETFNQKIQFRKLYDNNPLYSICADKYRVREYVKEKIGEEYLIPLYLVTDKLTEEQWEKLPNSFVAKANHNSGPVQIVKDKNKVNKKEIIKELNNQLKIDYGVLSMEKYYSDVPRKIIVEKFLKNKGEKDLKDYKFFCFNGEVKYCQVIKNRTTEETIDFYDMNWQKQNFIGLVNPINPKEKNSELEEKIPQNFDEMKRIASRLSQNFDFVRVDLYNIDGEIYFGELTFCPASGFGTFIPEEWNYKFGELWKQKELRNKNEIK
ncbi:ATP-grasp fold amidoligase family protein [Fusobacterium sp.]|uniref:ATP-grasp fold amidoligase family protein n=1 Tax=Fusobacterium sp. TaxID=68766 RepID=UPI0025BE5CBA|nr:ATP-grasp fold amidoligase family protein [Fusobacterium sp.]